MRAQNTTCQNCGKLFYSTPSNRAKGYAKHCSVGCASVTKRSQTIERFWSLVKKTKTCWLWQGYLDANGYGVTSIGNKKRLAHRLAFELSHPDEPIGKLFVLHKCDNPQCVRPQHLFLGTHQDNVDDMHSKKRGVYGEKHTKATLTTRQVESIRKEYAEGGTSHRILAKRYNVAQSTIGRIVSFKNRVLG